ncbi:MAG: phosphoribosyltransferase [Clostridia bacterium]|nr:phosphoribosyltransferase [Clostridia bacterium]
MSLENRYKISTKRKNLFLRVFQGHFATGHSHINYFIDVTMQKSRLSEAQAVAAELAADYSSSTIIDTILCLDGTEVNGTCLAEELVHGTLRSINNHKTIYVVTPEHTAGSQLIFRENTSPMISGKHVLVLAASVTTGYTATSAIEAVNYYNGMVAGVASIFATVQSCAGYTVKSVFDPKDLPDYASYPASECPYCKNGQKIEALINSFGYSRL